MNRIIKRKNKRAMMFQFKLKLKNTLLSGDVYSIHKNSLTLAKKKKINCKSKLFIKTIAYKRKSIPAPQYIDFYYEHNYTKTVSFFNKIRKESQRNKISINFDETTIITASAMICFLSEVDLILKTSPFKSKAITFKHPKNEKTESILKQVGFYDLVGKESRKTKVFDDVSYWNYASGAKSELQKTQSAMIEIENKIGRAAKRKLYKGFSEAMANSVEHAYYDADDEIATKWWAFAGVHKDKLIVVICDKGIGIPSSLPIKWGADLVNKTLGLLNIKTKTDSALIKAATRMGKTRTNQNNRGKGLSDVLSIINQFKVGNLSIFSNKGYYRYYGENGVAKDKLTEHNLSMCGTIVEWSIPLDIDSLDKEVVL
ncbi:ATP-binding protein [Citrobacter amalonaticus]|uniref:ATP-binding protein n=1 Tax=Citrobacter amalonaticus TaxID=35703 RepID=A0A9C7QLM2_CITAM|nr:ATP-binding protein [Citrobacter amalonaticus]UBI22416.1 ATP-binding protein [Citrobacter amalonaticus]HCD1256033.1 ATP-binding protein [Citrobacter amalonaticus]